MRDSIYKWYENGKLAVCQFLYYWCVTALSKYQAIKILLTEKSI